MLGETKQALKHSPFLVSAKRRVWAKFEFTALNLVKSFRSFAPKSAGKYRDLAALTVQSVNQTIPFLSELATTVGRPRLSPEDIVAVPRDSAERRAVAKLESLFIHYGSDKTGHDYHYLYGSLLADSDSIERIFEVGLGTNNVDIVSTMGTSGRPGASLRAFRDLCPNAQIFGADIDARVLFKEDRIATLFVDQTDPETLENLRGGLAGPFDLVIDDGLHSPNANVATLKFGLQIVKPGGWVVIEDIAHEALSVWQVVASILPAGSFGCRLFSARSTLVFAVQRLS